MGFNSAFKGLIEVGYVAHTSDVKNPCRLLVRRPEGNKPFWGI